MEENQIKRMVQLLISTMGNIRRTEKNMRKSIESDNNNLFLLMELARISQGDPISIGVFTETLQVSPAATTQFINQLQLHNFVKRTVCETDRRQVLVQLTDEGNQAVEEGQKKLEIYVNRLFAFLGDEDAQKLNEILAKISLFCQNDRGEIV